MDPNFDIASLMSKLTTNPGELVNMIPPEILGQFGMNSETLSEFITPELIEKAQNMASSSSVSNIMSQMKDKGINPAKLQTQAKNMMKKASSKGQQRKCVLVTTSRKYKSRNVSCIDTKTSVSGILLTPTPVEISCSRLAVGNLENKTIKIWYNPNAQGKNRLASKLAGFPIGGEIIVFCPDCDLTETDIISVESQLVNV